MRPVKSRAGGAVLSASVLIGGMRRLLLLLLGLGLGLGLLVRGDGGIERLLRGFGRLLRRG